MTDATANSGSSSAESESAMPTSLTLSEAAKINFDEPDDDEANDETAAASQEADEDADQSEEPDEGQGADETDEESDEPDAEGEANEADENATVTVKGEKLTVKQLILGNMMEKDYRHKTAELGQKTRNVESIAARVVSHVEALANYLAQQLPDEPHPSLAIQDPAEFTRQKAIFDMGLGRIQSILNMANEPKGIVNGLSEADLEEKLSTENATLLEKLPHLKKDGEREKFFASAFKAAEAFGYSPQELQDRSDHRDFMVMHWALKGLQADQARKKAMSKVENAPVITAKGKPASQTTVQGRKNQDAMKRLSKSGSIRDALQVDFE